MPITAIAMPPAAGPRIAPAWLTLPRYETPRAACSRGMTWASKAVRAGRSNPLAMPVDEDDREDPERAAPGARQQREDDRAAGDEALVTRMIARRSRRSATCPPKSTSESAGIASTSPSQPSASGSRVIS